MAGTVGPAANVVHNGGQKPEEGPFEAAQGSKSEWQHTSLQELEAWTDELYNDRPGFRRSCKKYLQIVASLSTMQHPLQLDKAPESVLPAQ